MRVLRLVLGVVVAYAWVLLVTGMTVGVVGLAERLESPADIAVVVGVAVPLALAGAALGGVVGAYLLIRWEGWP